MDTITYFIVVGCVGAAIAGYYLYRIFVLKDKVSMVQIILGIIGFLTTLILLKPAPSIEDDDDDEILAEAEKILDIQEMELKVQLTKQLLEVEEVKKKIKEKRKVIKKEAIKNAVEYEIKKKKLKKISGFKNINAMIRRSAKKGKKI